MQFVHAVDHAKRRITIVPFGRLTLEDMLANIERRVAEATWGYGVLYDVGEAALPSLDEVHRLASHARTLFARLGRCGPLAVVSQSPEADVVSRAAAAEASGSVSLRFFSDRGAAEAWLDRRQDYERSSTLRLVPAKARPSP